MRHGTIDSNRLMGGCIYAIVTRRKPYLRSERIGYRRGAQASNWNQVASTTLNPASRTKTCLQDPYEGPSTTNWTSIDDQLI